MINNCPSRALKDLSAGKLHEYDLAFLISPLVGPLGTRNSINFPTAWHKNAKLGDLESADLVTPDEADGLCGGILEKGIC